VPTQPYKNQAGTRVPGVTTVIGGNLGWSKDGLMFWANKMGLQGLSLNDARQNPANKAAATGTVVHDMIEETIHGRSSDVVLERASDDPTFSPEQVQAARDAFEGFRYWYASSRLRIIATEVWGVDEGYQTGYCADALAVEPGLDGKDDQLVLVDWKTSSGTYEDHVIQVAAYVALIERLLKEGRAFNGGEWDAKALAPYLGTDVQMGAAHVLRVDKETGMFSHKRWFRTHLEQAWSAFTHLRALHKMRTGIRAMCK